MRSVCVSNASLIGDAMSVLPGTSVSEEEVEATARRLGVGDCLHAVQSLTEEVFGGPVRLSVAMDPEVDDVSIVLGVRASRAVRDLQSLRSEWSRRMSALNHEHSGVFCLSVDPRP